MTRFLLVTHFPHVTSFPHVTNFLLVTNFPHVTSFPHVTNFLLVTNFPHVTPQWHMTSFLHVASFLHVTSFPRVHCDAGDARSGPVATPVILKVGLSRMNAVSRSTRAGKTTAHGLRTAYRLPPVMMATVPGRSNSRSGVFIAPSARPSDDRHLLAAITPCLEDQCRWPGQISIA